MDITDAYKQMNTLEGQTAYKQIKKHTYQSINQFLPGHYRYI